MMLKHCMAPAVALALALPAAAAAQTYPPQRPEQTQQREMEQRRDPQQHEVIRADRLIGQAVRDRQNERVGRIDDLALNLENGRVAYAVVSRGGMWGVGGEEVAVDWQQVRPDAASRTVRIEEQQLQQARRIETDQAWPAAAGEERPVGTAGTEARRVVPISNVIGMDVHNKQGERLGEIDDVAIGRDGSISYAVIAYGGFLGMDNKYTAVPWDRLDVNAERESVVLDVTREQLENARSFEYRGSWPAKVDWPFSGTGR